MKVALFDGLLVCAALLTAAHTAISQSTNSEVPLIPQSSSSQVASAFVEVHGDAVYCVEGPVCGGDAASQPIGRGCPKQGNKAIDACMKGIASFSAADGQCVAPTDAECRVIPGTQVWGCMWTTEDDASTTGAQAASVPAIASSPSSPAPASEAATLLPQATPAQRLRVANAAAVTSGNASAATSSTTIWIGSITAVGGAMAVLVVVVVVLRKKRKSRQTRAGNLKEVMVITPDNLPAVTPKLSSTVFVYTAQI